ncbi:hypothetical protein [Cellulophaga sp. BC115SP]|uniref:hypothetical protein n=1 Tax=Cellulophaga sp. BC115SP TaxID=2683263 RepID=UPI0014125162|nr:hypothetical protein [Cellulophaga sp. BC115SP]NBB31905.1 hypothetical protein [Cellulophaga sp. BC115SP]
MKKKHVSVVIWTLIVILIVYILLVLFGLNILESNEPKCTISVSNNYSNFGTLGDTIGGVLGPLISIIASILTYWALMEQVKANKKQAKQFRKQFNDTQKDKFREQFFMLLNVLNGKRADIQRDDFIRKFLNDVNFAYRAYHALDPIHLKYSESSYLNYINPKESRTPELEQLSLKIACRVSVLGVKFFRVDEYQPREKALLEKLFDLKPVERYDDGTDGYPDEFGNLPEPYFYYEFCINDELTNDKKIFYSLRAKSETERLFLEKSQIMEFLNSLKFLLQIIHNSTVLNEGEKEFYYSLLLVQLSQSELNAIYLIYVSGYDKVFTDEILLSSKFFRRMNHRRFNLYINPRDYFTNKFGDKINIDEFLEFDSLYN